MANQQRTLHPEWRDVNATVPYPFKDTARLQNGANRFIPEGTLLDAVLHPIGGGLHLRLSQVVVTHDTVTLYIGDENNDAVAYASFSTLAPPTELQLLDFYGRPAGVLVSAPSKLAIFGAWGIGTHVFTAEETEFVVDVCFPLPEIGLRGFVLDDGSVFTDDIWLIGDDGIVLSVREEDSVPTNCRETAVTQQVIRIDVVGDPLFRRRLCSSNFVTPNFLRTLTIQHGCRKIVCYPDELGDFKLTVGHSQAEDTILRIRAMADGLRVEVVGEALQSVQ